MDTITLTQKLIQQPSITPAKDDTPERLAGKTAALNGCFDLLEAALTPRGFACQRVVFDEPGFPSIPNLYASLGAGAPHLNFLGHVDVVPPGDVVAWTQPPFGGIMADGKIYGRGASDMKGNIAAYVMALREFLGAQKFPGTLSLLIVGDEESYAVNGAPKMVRWLQAQGIGFDYCLVGEPSNPTALGQEIKNGRRGTMNAKLTVLGTQGHIAYPERFDNPVTRLGKFIAACSGVDLDAGNEYFSPSRLEVNIIDLPNRTTNVVPNAVTAGFNIRWNSEWTRDTLAAKLQSLCDQHLGAGKYELSMDFSGGVFLTPRGDFLTIIQDAVEQVVGKRPAATTHGGTSDGRFVVAMCPFVVECGVTSQTIHQVDECVAIADLENLQKIYTQILRRLSA